MEEERSLRIRHPSRSALYIRAGIIQPTCAEHWPRKFAGRTILGVLRKGKFCNMHILLWFCDPLKVCYWVRIVMCKENRPREIFRGQTLALFVRKKYSAGRFIPQNCSLRSQLGP